MSKVLHIIIITVHTSKAVSSSRQLWPACSVHAAYTSWNIQTTVRNKIGSFEQCVAELRTRPRNQVSITRTNAVRYRRKKSFPDHHIDIIFFPMSYETEKLRSKTKQAGCPAIFCICNPWRISGKKCSSLLCNIDQKISSYWEMLLWRTR